MLTILWYCFDDWLAATTHHPEIGTVPLALAILCEIVIQGVFFRDRITSA